MIVGYHLIWTAYGWWLPSDPRGSSSHEIRIEKIGELGDLHHGRKRVQPSSKELRQFYDDARNVLKHPLPKFDDNAIRSIAEAFSETITSCRYTCYACAIMPDHVHALIRWHRVHGEQMITNLQSSSRNRLIASGLREPIHPVWGGPGWTVFLNSRQDIERIVKYIQDNPIKVGLPRQQWQFVSKYDGWLPRPAY